MKRKRHSPEKIIRKVRRTGTEPAAAGPSPPSARSSSSPRPLSSARRSDYAGMKTNDARRLKELERDNARLKKLVADQALDQATLKDAWRGKH